MALRRRHGREPVSTTGDSCSSRSSGRSHSRASPEVIVVDDGSTDEETLRTLDEVSSGV
jgi:hypothetical protein